LYAAVGNPNGSAANGVYETLDGAANWSASGNFPTGAIDPQIGRITLAISGSSPATLFASIAQRGANAFFKAIYKTTDGGATWTQLPGVPSYMGPYGDYNTTLAIDPSNPNVVYAGGQTSIIRTTNGGSSWSFIDVGVHADHHGIGFDASGRFLDGNDGGILGLPKPATLSWGQL